MKILYLHQYFVFPEDAGGTRSFDLARAFAGQGHEVEVITSSAFIRGCEFDRRWTTIERDGIKVHVLKLNYSNELSYLRRILTFISFLLFSSVKLLKLKGDCVLATSTPLTIAVPALVKKLFHGTPFIFEVRDVWPEAVEAIGAIRNKWFLKVLYGLESLVYRKASAIVPLSTDMKASIVSRFPAMSDKAEVVIENISEIDRFQAVEKPASLKSLIGCEPRFTVLYAGTFGRVNGLDYVVNLAEKLKDIDDSIAFLLIGDGAEKSNIRKLAEGCGVLGRNVFLIDPVSKGELPELYAMADMGASFVIDNKTLWANSANKFFDTLAAAKPVLINHGGWQAEVIERDDMGYVLPVLPELGVDTVNEFVTYTQNTERHSRQRGNALKCARENYSLDVAVAKYNDVFEEIYSDA